MCGIIIIQLLYGILMSLLSKFTSCILLLFFIFFVDLYGHLVSKFAREKIQPLVREMDERGHMPDHLIKDLFANGVIIILYTYW